MILQTDEGPDGHPDVVALSPGGSNLAAFDSGELLETSMVLFDRPGELGEDEPAGFVQAKVVGRPVRRVAVWSDCPKHFHFAEYWQPDDRSRQGDRLLGQRLRLAAASRSAKWSFFVLPSPSLW